MKRTFFVMTLLASAASGQTYDLLLQGGHVIDAKNNISAVRDVAIRDGAIAAVAEHLDPAPALKVVNVAGLYVTPGLVDIHVHVYAGTGERGSYAGDNSLYPDGYTFRVGVTTVADAGCSGWRNFEDFKAPRHRPLQNARPGVPQYRRQRNARRRSSSTISTDMEAAPDGGDGAEAQGPHRRLQNGSLRRTGVDAGGARRGSRATIAKIPVMVDFGADRPERPIAELLTKKLRPGDIYTHCYSGLRHELDGSGNVNPE